MTPDGQSIPHIVWCFDAGFESCTLISAYSLLKSTPGPVRLTLHPVSDNPDLPKVAEKLSTHFDQAQIDVAPISVAPFDDVAGGKWPPAALARLLLPRKHDGRLIYLDGDTIVRRDITDLWNTDLKGKSLGAALAPGIAISLAKAQMRPSGATRKRAEKIQARGQRLGGIDMGRYFNSGVLVMDLQRMRETGTADSMCEISGSVQFNSPDQDWLNIVFRDDCTLLDPTWNSAWGNPRTAKGYVPAEMSERFRNSREDPAIVHFTGAEKPWHAGSPPLRAHLLLKPLQRRMRATYWREFQELRAEASALLGRDLT